MRLDTSELIRVTGVDLRKLVAAVYANSRPQGLGFVHHREGEMPRDLVEDFVGTVKLSGPGLVFYMDYVLGRACKFAMYRCENDDLWVRREWPDHSELDFRRMLRDSGLKEDLADVNS